MERLPIALSLPHCGTRIPDEVAELAALTSEDVLSHSDVGLADVWGPLIHSVEVFATTRIACAIVDLDRDPEDRGPDGVIKTHTSKRVPVYRRRPPEHVVEALLARYYRPFHQQLGLRAHRAMIGLDVHGMASNGSRRSSQARTPWIRLHASPNVPCAWVRALAAAMHESLDTEPNILWRDAPGYITRSAPGGIPWIRIEFSPPNSRASRPDHDTVLSSMVGFCRRIQRHRG